MFLEEEEKNQGFMAHTNELTRRIAMNQTKKKEC